MKTTLEIADTLFREAKIVAAQKGMTLKDLVNQALKEKLERPESAKKPAPAWLRLEGAFGKTAADRAETRRIQEVIDREFELVEAEE